MKRNAIGPEFGARRRWLALEAGPAWGAGLRGRALLGALAFAAGPESVRVGGFVFEAPPGRVFVRFVAPKDLAATEADGFRRMVIETLSE